VINLETITSYIGYQAVRSYIGLLSSINGFT